jgi:hypothetical protein
MDHTFCLDILKIKGAIDFGINSFANRALQTIFPTVTNGALSQRVEEIQILLVARVSHTHGLTMVVHSSNDHLRWRALFI